MFISTYVILLFYPLQMLLDILHLAHRLDSLCFLDFRFLCLVASDIVQVIFRDRSANVQMLMLVGVSTIVRWCCRHLARSVVFSRSIMTMISRLKSVVHRGHTIRWQLLRWLLLMAQPWEARQEVRHLERLFNHWVKFALEFWIVHL